MPVPCKGGFRGILRNSVATRPSVRISVTTSGSSSASARESNHQSVNNETRGMSRSCTDSRAFRLTVRPRLSCRITLDLVHRGNSWRAVPGFATFARDEHRDSPRVPRLVAHCRHRHLGQQRSRHPRARWSTSAPPTGSRTSSFTRPRTCSTTTSGEPSGCPRRARASGRSIMVAAVMRQFALRWGSPVKVADAAPAPACSTRRIVGAPRTLKACAVQSLGRSEPRAQCQRKKSEDG